jgi:D-sedoheptulose 7-phosphate isomerase
MTDGKSTALKKRTKKGVNAMTEFQRRLEQTIDTLRRCAECEAAVEGLATAIVACLKKGNKVLCFGNGGSAAEALHFAAELTGRFQKERQGLAALALNADVAALTAIGNDYGFERVFERQVEALVRAGDVVIGLSTSGTSPNVLRGLAKAKEQGATTALLTSLRCPSSPPFVDFCLAVPTHDTAIAQEAHLLLLHWLCQRIDGEVS